MARVCKKHRAERSFGGELKKGACGEWVASHIRVTAAPSFCERRWGEYRRTKGEMSRRVLEAVTGSGSSVSTACCSREAASRVSSIVLCFWFWKAFQLKLVFNLNQPPALLFSWNLPRN